jgi:hypothetical protein
LIGPAAALAAILTLGGPAWLAPSALWAAPADSPVADAAGSPQGAAEVSQEPLFGRLKLGPLVAKADWVVHAEARAGTARWVGGNIETTYAFSTRESLIGEGPEEFELTVLGGRIPGSPIAQHVREEAQFVAGEEVVLFLRRDTGEQVARLNEARAAAGLQPLAFPADSKRATSPRLVGKSRGKFNVLTLEDGTKLLRRYRPAPWHADPDTQAFMANRERQQLARQAAKKAPSADAGRQAEAEAAGLQNYAPSAVTDPNAPEFRSETEALRQHRRRMPYNADAMKGPVDFELFKKEVARLAVLKGKAAPATTNSSAPVSSTAGN